MRLDESIASATPAGAPVLKSDGNQISKRKWWKSFKWLQRLVLLAIVVVAWQVISTRLVSETTAILMPAPSTIIEALIHLGESGLLFENLEASLKREFVALLFALIGIPIGIFMGWFKPVNEQLTPILEILRPIPPLAYIPLSLLWFGLSDIQNEFIIFLAIFFPILVNTKAGVKGIEQNLVRAARCLGAPEWRVLLRVVIIAALPQVVTGIRVGMGVGWMALVAAEIVGANSGLGFMINDARTMMRTDIITAGMLMIGFAGFAMDTVLRLVTRHIMPWSQVLAE